MNDQHRRCGIFVEPDIAMNDQHRRCGIFVGRDIYRNDTENIDNRKRALRL